MYPKTRLNQTSNTSRSSGSDAPPARTASRRGRRRLLPAFALALLAMTAPIALVAAAPSASATVCEARWGSLPKARSAYTGKHVTGVRAGRHQCFDRLVVDVDAQGKGRPGFRVRYVDEVGFDGSGDPLTLRGGARLQVIVHAPAYDEGGRATYRPDDPMELVDVGGYSTFRQAAWAGSFEGQSTIGLGVRARLPMRAFMLRGPGGGHRVVVDVAHRWW